MSKQTFYADLDKSLSQLKADGLFKPERVLASRQGTEVVAEDGHRLINMCANNYLGLSGQEFLVEAAAQSMATYGYGLSSVRFICGTQTVHKKLEQTLAEFLGMEDVILYAAAFDANGGLFEPLFDEQDAIISDSLNHASIIDGIRLCKAQRYRYANNDMTELEAQLKAARSANARHIVIATDGVFSMDGIVAKLDEICNLADRYDALVMVDECHASGFMGRNGRGTHEHCNVMGRIDIITGTLGKALGGAMGGFTAARREIIEILRQKSRPYLFSNSLAPAIAGTSLFILNQLATSTELRDRLHENTAFFRKGISEIGYTIKLGIHPVVPVIVFDAPLAQKLAARLYELGILVSGFFYPVVPMGQARVRVQLSAGHTRKQLEKVLSAFEIAGRELKIVK